MVKKNLKCLIMTVLAFMTIGIILSIGGVNGTGKSVYAQTATPGDAEIDTSDEIGLWGEDENYTGVKIIDGHPYAFYYGTQMTEEGWDYLDYDDDTCTYNYVYIDENGYAASYFEDEKYLYEFNENTGEYEMCKGKWRQIRYYIYYFSSQGIATRYYDGARVYDRTGDDWTLLSGCLATVAIDAVHPYIYYIDSYGKVGTSTSAWYQVNSAYWAYNSAKGYISIRMARVNGYYCYQTYDYATGTWSNYKKSGWRKVGDGIYYFSANGVAIRKYEDEKCYDLSTGTPKLITNTVALFSTDGRTVRYYYINDEGCIYTQTTAWIKVNNCLYVYNSAAGYITIRNIYSGGYWQYQTYDYTTSTWSNYKKNGWRAVYDKYFYFAANGVAVRYFNGYYCFNLSKGSATLLKNTFALVGTDYMYFTANGLVAETGVYKQGSTQVIYTCDNIVLFWKKYVSGKWYNYRYDSSTHKFVYDNSVGVRVCETAMEHLGLKYVWGGENLNTGVDCSGLLVASYRQYGVSLPHSSKLLMSVGTGVANNYKYWKPGDIITTDGHARMYAGNGCIIETIGNPGGVMVTSGRYKAGTGYVIRRVS